MKVSYKPLWKLLIERDLKKSDLRIEAGISPSTFAKLSRNENVTMNTLCKICDVLDCELSDIVDSIK